MTFEQWQQLATDLRKRSDALQAAKLAFARKEAARLGFDPSAPFHSAHNWGFCSDDPTMRKAGRYMKHLERQMWAISSMADRIVSRAWERVIR